MFQRELVHWCEFPNCMKDFRTGKSFATIRSRKINFTLRFSQSLVEIMNETWMYGKTIIVLDFLLDVGTVRIVYLCFELSLLLFLTILCWIRCYLPFASLVGVTGSHNEDEPIFDAASSEEP